MRTLCMESIWINIKIFVAFTFVNIRDGFCSPIENWAWMNDENAPEDWKWLYSRNRTASVTAGMFDMSDGGMTYWLISGATNGGNEKGNWDDIHAIFNKAKN
jgi:hypothetical protein